VFGPGVDPATPVPADGFNAVEVVPNQSYLIAIHSAGTTDPGFVYVRREDGKAWRVLLKPSDHLATSGSGQLAAYGSKLYALLQNDPNGRVVAVDLARPELEPSTVIPTTAKVIEGVFGAADGLYVEYRNGLSFEIAKVDSSGAPKNEITLPFQGSVYGIDGSPTESGLRLGLDSRTHSPLLLSYDPRSAEATDTGIIAKHPADVSHLVAHEVRAPSTVGASVPISIIARDDIKLDGSHPTLFEGYGAYGLSIDPTFSATMLEWVRRGGVLAYSHVRGGGEFGESWHVAGEKTTKQRTIDE
jgi:prolyl oligopeptidase